MRLVKNTFIMNRFFSLKVVQEEGTGTVDIADQIDAMKKEAETGALKFTAPGLD